MSTLRRLLRFAPFAFTGVALALSLVAASPARGDGEPDTTDLDEAVARLRNPFFAKDADRDLRIVQFMLGQRAPKADAFLRDLLADTGAHPTVVEQIAIATMIDPDHRLLPEVVDRLRREADSELDRSLDTAFLNYSDASLVRRLVELARDSARPAALRVEAVVLLGRTGSPDALDPLLEFWGGPQLELRDPAARAFVRIVPAPVTDRDEALAVRERMRGIPFTEALRRLLKRGGDPARGAGRDVESDYVKLAAQMLPRATLEQVLESYVGSSVPAVRTMGAKRIAEFPFDASEAPEGKLRAARECLTALHREDDEGVELELLAALTARAQELRGVVGDSELSALTERVRLTGRASNAVRLAAVRLVGELRDPRAVAVMEETFTSLGDGDVELRLALLDALQQEPGDLTQWLIPRLAAESHTRVVRKLVVLLNRTEDPAAVAAFARLLATHPDQQVRWDVAKALGTIWAGRQLPSARDALLGAGLSDADATVRRTSAASLGSEGPGRDAIVERLQKVIETDADSKVRQAAAKSIVDLDEASAAKNLLPYVADDVEIWQLFRDHLVEDVRRRDKTPERVLAAADVLVEKNLRRLAVDLLMQVAAAHDGLWEAEGGRGVLLERLVTLLLAQNDPDTAKPLARELVAGIARESGAPRRRAELLLAMTLVRSARPDELREARRSLDALRSADDLPDAQRAEAAVELGDCMLKMSDALAAVSVLSPVTARTDLTPALAKRATVLLDDAKRRAEEDKQRVHAWVDGMEGAQAADMQERLKDFGPRAAGYLLAALDETKEPVQVRRVLRAVALVTGGNFAQIRDDADPADVAKAAGDARTALRAVIQRTADALNAPR